RERPTLTLVYLPHLDYSLQRLGPAHPTIAAEVAAVDALCGELIEAARRAGAAVVVLSEYGITGVSRPVHVNRALRRAGWLAVREELGREQLDAGASQAFAVADHQVAHVYVARPELVPEVAALLGELPGVERVLDAEGKRAAGLDHPRSGELVAISDAQSWFTYYHFLDDDRAPDYARTVDIHRKPGYDPCELFVDPALALPKLRIASFLLKKKLGLRGLLEVVPLDAALVKGSHGRDQVPEALRPVVMGLPRAVAGPQDIAPLLRDIVLEKSP
ncbi:MAG: alkaline phosphatase family protein, partial [Akkermansiaceae bacterium]|nr:alkaline phosphatase family protein [Akkermansiaceae bacterium]